jgi:hypothetical protein
MVQRGTLIAALVGVEIALVVMMVQAIHPGARALWHDAALREFHGSVGHASGDATNYAFTTGAHPEVTVDIDYADLTIERRSGPGVTVDVQRHGWHGFGNPPKITAAQQGDTIDVSAASESSMTFRDDRMVTIEVSPQTRVEVTNAGNIRATGLRGDTALYSKNGWITVEDFDAPSLRVVSSNGRLTLHNIVAPSFEATSSNGRVEGTALNVRDGNVASSNGRVTLGFVRGADTTVTAASSNGKVRVSGFGAVADAAPKSNDDEDDDDESGSAERSVRIGAGGGRLDVRASNGNINLSQEG